VGQNGPLEKFPKKNNFFAGKNFWRKKGKPPFVFPYIKGWPAKKNSGVGGGKKKKKI
jgi:hypothetical protein